MITYWGIIGAGKPPAEFPPNALGGAFGRNGGGGGASRIANEFEAGFIGACCLRSVFGLGGRLLSTTTK